MGGGGSEVHPSGETVDMNSHAHSEGSSGASHQTEGRVSGLWEGRGAAGGSPHGHGRRGKLHLTNG